MTIHLRADQVVSGLALTFLGTGLARVLGEGLSRARRDTRCIPQVTIPVLSEIPVIGPIFFTRPARARLRRLPARAARLVLDRPDAAGPPPARRRRVPGRRRRPGDRRLPPALRLRRSSAGCWPGWPARRITLAISPGWFGDQTVNGRGWIAIGLVIFAQWSPIRAAFGALPVRRDPPVHPRHPGGRRDPRRREPVPGRPLGDVLPRDAAVPDGHPRGHHRVARGGAEAGRGAGRARAPVRPRRTRGLGAAWSLVRLSRTSRPWSSIWT